MNTPTQPQKSDNSAENELLQAEDFDEYVLRSRAEILAVLRSLRDSQTLITLYFDHSGIPLLTSVLGASDSGIALDFASDPTMNSLALKSKGFTAAATLDKVKIQFPVGALKQGLHQGRPAFSAPLPNLLLRLQRREYYRLTAPSVRPIRCRIPASLPDGTHKSVEANIIDIGGGGLAVVVPPAEIPFEAGMGFHNCRVDLPEVGIVVSDLQVRSTFELAAQGGLVVSRAGCQFMNLPGPMLTLIQRYIMRIERERKARESERN
jgi:c-di-GMP-binding flagellar brake protein YcgR